MTCYVWGSNTITQFEPTFSLRFVFDPSVPEPDPKSSLEIRKGVRLDPSLLPIHGVRIAGKAPKLPAFFYLNYHILSEDVADIFRDFDLGEGYLHPIAMYDKDEKTSLGTHYILVPGNTKTGLLPDRSSQVRLDDFGRYTLPPVPSNDGITMSSNVLDGPDVWNHDPFLKGVYLSDRLVAALKANNLHFGFHLFRVKIE